MRRLQTVAGVLGALMLLASGSSASGKAATSPPPVALLYHEDAQVRIQAIRELAMTGDRSLVDDLIRAESVEFYTPVHNAYRSALRSMTGGETPPDGSNWKAWLAGEVAAGRLEIDYLPLDLDGLDPKDRERIQPLAARLGPEHFDEMAAALLAEQTEEINYEGLRYLAANDHLPRVQEFLKSDWVIRLMAHPSVNVNSVAYHVNLLANPGPLRDRINARVRACLDADNPTVVANALHLLAGKEGYSTVFTVPGVEARARELADSPLEAVAHQARRAMARVNPLWNAEQVSYEQAFVDLYETLGREYPCFELKGIDWKAVGEELLPRVREVATDDEFGLVCLELVARLEDSHADLGKGTRELPQVPFAQWDPGFACLVDDRGKPVVYHVDPGGPAESAGVKVGMTVVSIDGTPAAEAIERSMRQLSRYVGYSSDRYLRYDAARHFCRRMEEGAIVTLKAQTPDGQPRTFELPATLGVRYLPRLPVPTAGIADSANVSWIMLDGDVGYLYVRRIRGDLIEKLDRAVRELKDARGLVVDVRGNSGGGFDSARSLRNFDSDDVDEPDRPRFAGPMALLIDARCISAGEGWASWFIANKRARVFGEATAGASSRKRTYTLENGFYGVTFPVKAYRGYLDRPIERRGLEPDVPLRQNARDLAAGRDTVLEAARQHLLQAEDAGS
ncbi:MAG TPA: S41 family peptidase [Thermoguttaceae bacterium]|nr:S41 family peptidase [Thermoguttaceae bacterium]